MSSVLIRNALSTEITAIPSWIKTILGSYYNNTLCNGATWMLVMWKILHVLYNTLMQRFLKRIGTKGYVTARLTNSLWFCGFFSSVLTYYLVTFDENKFQVLRGNHVTHNENLPPQVILAYTVICTFYLYTAFLEGLEGGSLHSFVKPSLLCVVCTSAYISRLLEIPFSLSALIAIPAITEQLTIMVYSVLSHFSNVFVGVLYIATVTLFTLIYLTVIPLIFLIPLGKRIISGNSNAAVNILFSSLILWLISTIYNSILIKSIHHWLNHAKKETSQDESEEEEKDERSKQRVHCSGNLIECSLFPTRADDAYVLKVLRSEVKERKMKMDAKRKPKTGNMIIQTLKCMMTLKKKLREKHMSESSDSDQSVQSDKGTEDNNATHLKDNGKSELQINELKQENKQVELNKEADTVSGETNTENICRNDSDLEHNEICKIVYNIKEYSPETEVIFDSVHDAEKVESKKSSELTREATEEADAKFKPKRDTPENIKLVNEDNESHTTGDKTVVNVSEVQDEDGIKES